MGATGFLKITKREEGRRILEGQEITKIALPLFAFSKNMCIYEITILYQL